METMALKASVPVQDCYSQRQFTAAAGVSSSAAVDSSPRVCRGGRAVARGQTWHLGLSRIDRLPTSGNVNSFHPVRATTSGSLHTGGGGGGCGHTAEVLLSARLWTGGMQLQINVPTRKLHESNALVITARSKTKKAPKEIIPHRDLLAQVRHQKKLSWLLREQELSQEGSKVKKVWPHWGRKRKADIQARYLTKRISQLGKRRQLTQVFDVLEEAQKEGMNLGVIIMNAVVEACVCCDDVDRAEAIYREMLRPGNCGVDNITYGSLLKGLGQAHRLDDAFALTEAIEAGTAPGNPVLSDVHLNTLVNACVEAGDTLRARSVLLRYRSAVRGSGPSVLTYNLLIKGYARSTRPMEALKLKDEMLAQQLQPQRLTYNSLIFACVRAGNFEKALELFTEMKAEARRLKTSRLLPDVVTYTTILKGLADSGNSEGVSSLVSEMKRSPTCVLDRIAYSAIIDAFIGSGCPHENIDDVNGILPVVEWAKGVICESMLKFTRLEEDESSKLERGWTITDEFSFPEGLLFFTEEMKERAKVHPELKPKAHVYLALMRAFAESGNMDVVVLLRQQMVSEAAGRVCPEDRAQADELLIETAVNSGELNVAKEVLRKMVGIKKGIPLSQRANMAIVRLQVLLGYSHDIFKPYLLKSGVSPQDTVDSVMLPYEEAKPLHGDLQLKKVIMRFFKDDAVPVVDNNGACIGVVHSVDCVELDARLCDIMRVAPPEVTNSTPVLRAVNLLLEPQVEVVVVVSNRTSYSTNKSLSKEVRPLGFVKREIIFSRSNSLLEIDSKFDQQSSRDVSLQIDRQLIR